MATQARKPAGLTTSAEWDDLRPELQWPTFDNGWLPAPSAAIAVERTEDVAAAAGPGPEAAIFAQPSDGMLNQQWHLVGAKGINIASVWSDYNGAGIKIGVIDDGFDYKHKDIAGNYLTSADYDARSKDFDAYSSTGGDKHGTTTSGTIAAVGNNGGVVGVAYEADLYGFRMGFGSAGSNAQILDAMSRQGAVDISNNSWGFGGFFYDNFNSPTFAAIGNAIATAATSGRGGLGTVFVFSAGNEGAAGQDVNYHSFQNSKYTIAVGATDINGNIASFSTPGAAVLVSAPGVAIVTTDRTAAAGYVKGDYVSISGTSFSAPIVSGVVALMLDANPNLGQRDIQEILAYSARNPTASNTGWEINGATNWNGGGLHFSHDYGFGLVDAHAAVRLAETWSGAADTWGNVVVKTGTGAIPTANGIPDGTGGALASSLTIGGTEMTVDRVEVAVNISHSWIGDLVVTLTSPTLTVSTLVDRPGVSSSSVWGSSQDNIVFTLDTVQDWGETANGTWTLTVKDVASGDTGRLNSWSIALYGDNATADDLYVYTDEFSRYGNSVLTDSDGGIDTINLAAVTSAVTLDLRSGNTSTVTGATLAIGGNTIENAWLGDGNDIVFGNDWANLIHGGRGHDNIHGDGGADFLFGDAGADILYGDAGNDIFGFLLLSDAGDTIGDFTIGQDFLDLSDLLDSLSYTGFDPFAEGWIVETLSGGNLQIGIDSDGSAGAGGATLLATLTGVTAILDTSILVA